MVLNRSLVAGALVIVAGALGCATARAPAPDVVPDPADAPRALGPAVPIRAVVLQVDGGALSADEARVVTDLVAVRVERNGVDVTPPSAVSAGCPGTACLAAVAAAEAVDMVLLPEHAELGGADVLTINAWDAARGRLVRDAVSTAQRGELAERLGPVVDGVVARVIAGLPPLRQPGLRQKAEQLRLDTCADARGWSFCDASRRAITENDAVRRYRAQTNRRDFDFAEVNRVINYEPWELMGAGGATGLVVLGISLFFITTPDGQALARQSQDAWVVVPALGVSAALGLLVYGLVELDDGVSVQDGSELDHVLSLAQGRALARAYDDAVLVQLQREAGGGS